MNAGKAVMIMGLSALVPVAGGACTGFYVGRKVSSDGTTLIARTVDSHPPTDAFATVVVPRGTNTWKYVCTPYANRSLRYASGIVNEKGLAVTGTVTAYTDAKMLAADPFVKAGGACEDTTPEHIAARATTAREAVEMLGAFIAAHGNAEANVYMFADAKEAWYAETYTGHHWAAVKMPEDKVAVFGNQFMLETVDPASPDCRVSPDFMEIPAKAGKVVRRADGQMDVARTFGIPLCDVGNLRTWDGHRLLAPSTAGAYATQTRYPLFYAPDRKVSPADIRATMRSRLEGTEYCPETRKTRDSRVIGTEIQCTEHILSVRDGVPAPLACMAWVCHADSEHSVFLPISAAVTETAPAYARILGGADEYRPNVAACAFRRLSALCALNRATCSAGVRAFWLRREAELTQDWQAAYEKALALYARDPDGAAALLTRQAVSAQKRALADAKRLFDQVVWYLANTSESFDFDVDKAGVAKPRPKPAPFAPTSDVRKK